jgi:hypothetical protein
VATWGWQSGSSGRVPGLKDLKLLIISECRNKAGIKLNKYIINLYLRTFCLPKINVPLIIK